VYTKPVFHSRKKTYRKKTISPAIARKKPTVPPTSEAQRLTSSHGKKAICQK